MKYIFNTFFFEPLYNLLVWLSAVLPGHSVGLAIVILTLGVRLVLFPFQHRMTHTQERLKQLEPTIKQIKTDYAKDNAEQAKRLLALYREHGINPWAGFLSLIIQIPLLLALFYVFNGGFDFKPELIYSFIHPPATVGVMFLWLIDLTKPSLILGFLAGVAQAWQGHLAARPTKDASDIQRSLSWQTRYIFPVLIIFIASRLPAAIALYWLIGNIFTAVHTLWIKKKFAKPAAS